MESETYTYRFLKNTFFQTGMDVVLFKNPITWGGNIIIGIRKNHKMIAAIEEDGSSTYNLSRVEDYSYFKLFYDALMESI